VLVDADDEAARWELALQIGQPGLAEVAVARVMFTTK